MRKKRKEKKRKIIIDIKKAWKQAFFLTLYRGDEL